tara:strand:+ start:3011 stop:3124 length:114 start_codon:yes stop_codon:yes gene_type:complete
MAVSGQFQYKKLSRQMAVSTGKKKWEAVSTTSHLKTK